MTYQLAQINIGRLRAPLGDPQIAGFVALRAPLNALADGAAGFVWRLQHYQKHGATPYAFWFSQLYPAPEDAAPE
jgi:hypothetical protein